MKPSLEALLQPALAPRSLRDVALPPSMRILVAAPHPDDFDAIAMSLRHLHRQGHEVDVAVLTAGASGVDDGFEGAQDAAAKAALREAEQRASCAFFGLPQHRLAFLRLWDAGADDVAPLRAWLLAHPPDLLFMPHGNDSNATHRRTFEAVREAACAQGLETVACLNRDAKTLAMRVDLFFDFDEDDAQWKSQMLRHHCSQQARNLRTRGSGFDARVLAVNRRTAQDLGTPLPYAEAFELVRLGA